MGTSFNLLAGRSPRMFGALFLLPRAPTIHTAWASCGWGCRSLLPFLCRELLSHRGSHEPRPMGGEGWAQPRGRRTPWGGGAVLPWLHLQATADPGSWAEVPITRPRRAGFLGGCEGMKLQQVKGSWAGLGALARMAHVLGVERRQSRSLEIKAGLPKPF